MTTGAVAVIDIGKTNAKLALVDRATLAEIAVETRPNAVRAGPPYPHMDVDGIWSFLLGALGRFAAEHPVEAISVTTHGAAAALLAADGTLAAPILDYEHTGPDALAADYDRLRPDFAETGSPRLPMGLNLGAQLHWQFATVPGLAARTHRIVTYPQFWGHRLTGVAATDVTSLGCHTDLWNPHQGRASSLVARLGIADRLAPPMRPGEVLGPLLPEVAKATGLPASIPVFTGIHDSNASLLGHLVAREPPFSVVSTGTWVIAMAVGGTGPTLDPARDTLVNVDAFGRPVPSARFMGGREYDTLTGGRAPPQTAEDIAALRDTGVMLLPSVLPRTGPFQGRNARWIGEEPPIASAAREIAASFYLALVTEACLGLVGHRGDVIVEGPFARNGAYLGMLASASGARVRAMRGTTGTSQGAALLARDDGDAPPVTADRIVMPDPGLRDYADRWRKALRET